MADDPQPLTLQQRIAALNAAHLGRLPGDSPAAQRQKPQVLQHRPELVKHNTINIPHEQVNGSVTDAKAGNQPNGPALLPVRKQPPPLPQRNGTTQSTRQTMSERSNGGVIARNTGTREATDTKLEVNNRIKAPAWGQGDLPTLPPKSPPPAQPTLPDRPQQTRRVSSQGLNIQSGRKNSASSISSMLPPPLPNRKSSGGPEQLGEPPARRLAPIPTQTDVEQAKRTAFTQREPRTSPDQEKSKPLVTARPPLPGQRPNSAAQLGASPPPIPLGSRPDLSALQATKPKFVPTTSSQPPAYDDPNGCMVCRDFSAPDQHAARYPRQQVTSLPDLAYQLTAPFQSQTDKARAIFAWLHYNVSYDVESFFNDRVKGSTPQSTLQSGLAVCEGYAALFTNLANHAGMESVVISGHGKGYGYTPLGPGEPVPPYKAGHAWNAVRIDHGEWKLLDPCWGAGHVQDKGKPYVPHFNPSMFTMSNEEFGIKHFPSNKNQFFLPNGQIMSWEHYIQLNPDRWPYDCDPPTLFSNAKDDHSVSQHTVLPRDRRIPVNSAGLVRFQFGLPCEHWTLEKHTKKGLPPCFILAAHGVDGRKDDFVPLEYMKGRPPGGGGDLWYLDIPARELGAPGQTITIFAITTFGDRQNCRGLTVREFLQGKGKVGMSFSGIAAWDLV